MEQGHQLRFLASCPLLLVLFASQLAVLATAIKNPEDFTNLLAGTFTDGNVFSTGNTLPLVGYPWGFNHWAPQTAEGSRHVGSWWFHGSEHRFTFMRCTHQPSPWIGDWGWFLFTPQMGPLDRNIEHAWEPRAAFIKPYYFDATVAPWGIRMELVPSMHGSIFRVTFPAEMVSYGGLEKRICFAEAQWGASGRMADPGMSGFFITGRATQINSERFAIANFGMHVRAESPEAQSIDNHNDLVCFKYAPQASTVIVRIATSLISPEQAVVSLNRELPRSQPFEQVLATAKSEWNTLLRRVDVVDPGELSDSVARHLTIFYSGLVRALSFPRNLAEVDAAGRTVHYSPYNTAGKTYPGPLFTDNGFWDTFRTVYPLLALCFPDHLGTIIEGWLNAFKEGGWLPSWSSPGYRNSMVGTYGDVIVADAVIKGITGFNLKLAEAALMKDAFEAPPQYAGGAVGKEGLREYVERGFFHMSDQDRGSETVSRTLDFGFADFAAAKAFDWLSVNKYSSSPPDAERTKKASALLNARSERAVRAMYDSGTGLMLPKREDGARTNRWNEVEWGNGYTEGNAWHHSFPPYALSTLVQLHGGKDVLVEKIRHMLTMPSHFIPGSYNQVIHEMLEMRALAMGQYGHNNQPVHHILYLLGQLGDRSTMETAVRKVLDRAYGEDYFAGDEDNGEQGAWFVLSALGLYATTPGTPDYVIGSPIFKHVRVSRGGARAGPGPGAEAGGGGGVSGAALHIIATGTSQGCAQVSEAIWSPSITTDGAPSTNGKPPSQSAAPINIPLFDGAATGRASIISYDKLGDPAGGVLRLVMCGDRLPDGTLKPYDAEAAVRAAGFGVASAGAGGSGSDVVVEKRRVQEALDHIESLKQELSHSHDLNEELQHRLTTIQNNHNSASSAWASLTGKSGAGAAAGAAAAAAAGAAAGAAAAAGAGAGAEAGGVPSGLSDNAFNSSFGAIGSGSGSVALVLGLGLGLGLVMCLFCCCLQATVRGGGGRGFSSGFSTPFFNRGRKEPVRTV